MIKCVSRQRGGKNIGKVIETALKNKFKKLKKVVDKVLKM